MFKQLSKEFLKNKIFIALLLVLCTFTSFMFFFVRFSTDGNMMVLSKINTLSENQQLYLNALNSNKFLAANMFIVLIFLTAFVFAMFYYRFLKSTSNQIGCLKSLGFRNNEFYKCFALFTVFISLFGALAGLGLGYFVSDVILNANMRSYSVNGLVKAISSSGIVIGVFTPSVVFCAISAVCYSTISKKEAGVLMSGSCKQSLTKFTLIANAFVKLIPVKNKFPIRIALRKPIALLLVIVATMGFTVMFVLGYSLTLSSKKVYDSQTVGHFYRYDTVFDGYKTGAQDNDTAIHYLHADGTIEKINQEIVGMEYNSKVFALKNADESLLQTPNSTSIYISPALNEMYGINVGDRVSLNINSSEYSFIVTDIAANAKSNAVYIQRNRLAEIMELPSDAFTGVLSIEPLYNDGLVTTYEEKISGLERDAVSNKNSALINQVVGCIVGCILIFLALLLNFQDNTNDMLILHSIGYRAKEIRKLFVDVYLPIVWVSFFITLAPSIFTANSVQRSLSLQMGDYIPFQINIVSIIIIFLLINAIYLLVQFIFSFATKLEIAKH